MQEGEAVQIVIPKGNQSFELNRAALERILLQENIKDKCVVVISVAGAFRKGKSFLLSFFLRYLSAEDCKNWMGEFDEPLAGFKWRASRDRVTTGIFMWSKPFLTRLPSGQEVAILLMDTQGTFDHKSTEKENSTVFALSAMLSSILIYNISENLHEYDLTHLQKFAEYGKLALDTTPVAEPFQKLVFLIRDYPIAKEWGAAGGKALLEERMQVQSGAQQVVRDLIRSSFSESSCFLLPHPGKYVTSKENFDGRLLDIDEDFRYHLKTFISDVLEPSNLVVKNISGNDVTAKNFIQYFISYMEIFSSDVVPSPKNILVGVIESDNFVASANAKELYSKKMDELINSISIDDGLDDEEQKRILEKSENEFAIEAMNLFDSMKKTGGHKYSKKYRDDLIEYMDSQYEHLLTLLRNKKGLKIAVLQAVSMLKKGMDEMYGINTKSREAADIDKTYIKLMGEAIRIFYGTAEAFVRADKLIPVYKRKMDREIENICKFYIELNSEKSFMSQMVYKVLQQYRLEMEAQFAEFSDPVNPLEFLQAYMQIRSAALKHFDGSKCSQHIAEMYKDKLEKDMQDIKKRYEEINNRKLYYEEGIENILMVHKNDWQEDKEVSMKKAKKQMKKMIGRNVLLQKYLMKLEEKLIKTWKYEQFVCSAKDLYKKCMKDIINAESGKVTEEEADRQHAYSKAKAVDSLSDAIKEMGEDEEYVGYAKQLDHELQRVYMYYKGLNDAKKNGCTIL